MKLWLRMLCAALAMLLALSASAETLLEAELELPATAEEPTEEETVALPETDLSELLGPEEGEAPIPGGEDGLPEDEPLQPLHGEVAATPLIGEEAAVYDAASQAETLRLSATSLTLGVKEKFSLKPVVPVGTAGITFGYATSSKKVARVSADGIITARKKGSATITVQASTGERLSCAVKVVKAPKKIALSASSATLAYDAATGAGTQLKLSATFPKGGASQVKFSGYDANVVSVSADGVVTAKGPGSTTVTASTFNKKKARCKVTVLAAPESIAFVEKEPVLIENEKRVLALKATPAKAAAVARFASDNPKVAKVNPETGEVTALAIGGATITATSVNGKKAACRLSVLPGPDRIELPARKVLLGKGDQVLLGAVPVRSDGTQTGTGLSYRSSKAKCVAVGADGTLTGRKQGASVVTVTAPNGVKATCTVKVVKAPKSVKLSADRRALQYDPDKGVAEKAKLKVSLPKNTASSIVFTGYDPSVVSVSTAGTVTPVGLGSTTITARTFNGKTASFRISVYAPGKRVNHDVVNVAHRGGKGNWTENTLEAFRHAAATGATAVELDARSTKDGAQVVHHDAGFTAGGRKYAIKRLTLAQLRQLKPDICTLDEALDVIDASGLRLVLELKDTGNAQKCVSAVKSHGMRGRTMYISFSAKLLRQVKKLDGSAEVGYLINKTPSGLMKTLKSLGTNVILQNVDCLTAESLFDWQDAGYKVGIWTVNDAAAIQKWLGLGVDYITSDYPKRVTEALK